MRLLLESESSNVVRWLLPSYLQQHLPNIWLHIVLQCQFKITCSTLKEALVNYCFWHRFWKFCYRCVLNPWFLPVVADADQHLTEKTTSFSSAILMSSCKCLWIGEHILTCSGAQGLWLAAEQSSCYQTSKQSLSCLLPHFMLYIKVGRTLTDFTSSPSISANVLLIPGSKKQMGTSPTAPLSLGVAFKELNNDVLSCIMSQTFSGPSAFLISKISLLASISLYFTFDKLCLSAN